MPLHLFKLSLQLADLYIHSIDFSKNEIKYEVRDKEEGKLMEPVRLSKFTTNKDQFIFDANRTIDLNLAKHIQNTLA